MLWFFSSESKISDEISHLEDDMGDMEMARAVEQMKEIKAVVLSLVPRVVESLKRKECNGCYINHGSQDQHSCLDLLTFEAAEEKMETRLDTALGHCSEELVGLVYRINGRAMPPILVQDVKKNYGDIMKQEIKSGVVGTVSSEEMVRTLVSTVECLF